MLSLDSWEFSSTFYRMTETPKGIKINYTQKFGYGRYSSKIGIQMYLKYFDAYDRTKYTGYEKIRLITDGVNNILRDMYGSDEFYIEYNTLCNSLRGNNG